MLRPRRAPDPSRLVRSLIHRATKRAAAVLSAFVWLFVPLAASPVRLPPVTINKLVLPNGLRAFLLEDHSSTVVSVQVWYHVGSKDEVFGKTGYAHMLEHLMFQGTKNLAPEEFSQYIVRSGGLDNAYTTEDATVFWETVPSSQLPLVLWLEAERMRNLDITEHALNIEKEVVKEERRLHFENQPYGTVVEALYRQAFTVHPYQHTPIGSMDDVSHVQVAELRDFYNTYYLPNNATLVIVGDFDSPAAESLVRRYFGPIAPGRQPVIRKIAPEPPQTSERRLKLSQNVALAAFVAGYHMPADGTPDAYPLRLAAKLLSDGESARIYQRLVYDKQIALEAQSTGNFAEDPNLFFILAIIRPGHAPQEAEREVEAELDRLKTTLVSKGELSKAKNQILRDFILNRQTAQARGEELGYAAVVLKDAEFVNTELGRFLAVTPEDIQRVARKYFVLENRTLVEVYPQGKGQGSSARISRSEPRQEKADAAED